MQRRGLALSVVGLICFAAAVGCKRNPSSTVFLDPALAVLVPAQTKLMVGVRLQRLLADAKSRPQVAASARLASFRKEMGLPKDTDIWELILTYDGEHWLAFMRGKFTEMGMEPRLTKPGVSRLTHSGVTVLGDENGAVAFLNPTTAIAGNLKPLLRALDGRDQDAGVPAELTKLAANIPARYDIWFASAGTAPEFFKSVGVRTASGGIDLGPARYRLQIDATEGSQTVMDAPVPTDLVEWVLGDL